MFFLIEHVETGFLLEKEVFSLYRHRLREENVSNIPLGALFVAFSRRIWKKSLKFCSLAPAALKDSENVISCIDAPKRKLPNSSTIGANVVLSFN